MIGPSLEEEDDEEQGVEVRGGNQMTWMNTLLTQSLCFCVLLFHPYLYKYIFIIWITGREKGRDLRLIFEKEIRRPPFPFSVSQRSILCRFFPRKTYQPLYGEDARNGSKRIITIEIRMIGNLRVHFFLFFFFFWFSDWIYFERFLSPITPKRHCPRPILCAFRLILSLSQPYCLNFRTKVTEWERIGTNGSVTRFSVDADHYHP